MRVGFFTYTFRRVMNCGIPKGFKQVPKDFFDATIREFFTYKRIGCANGIIYVDNAGNFAFVLDQQEYKDNPQYYLHPDYTE